MTTPRRCRHRYTLAALFIVALAAAPGPQALDPPPTEPAPMPLVDVMEGLKAHLKFIAQHLSDPAERPAVLEHVHDMQRLAWLAKTMTPETVAALPEPDRSARQLEFRRTMNEVLIQCCRLEMHLIDGSPAQAWGIIKGPLLKLREKGHEQFQEDDDG